MYKVNPWRPIAFIMGASATAVGCYSAYEYGLSLNDGKLSYLAIGACIVPAMATIIPPLAEYAWRNAEPLKSFLWWIALVPAGAIIFFSAAERVHHAKASNEAEITAKYNAMIRAREELKEVKTELAAIVEKEARAKAAKEQDKCNADCRTTLVLADSLHKRLVKVKTDLFDAEKNSVADSQWKAPPWLLPVALDIISFMAIWTSLSGPWIYKQPVSVMSKRQNMSTFARSFLGFGSKSEAA